MCSLLVSALGIGLCLSATGRSEEPQKVGVCQLQGDPSSYNHKLLEVEGFVSSDFEDFTLFDPTCRAWPAIWLQYGGKNDSGTMYCCGITPNSHHPDDLIVEGVSIPLVETDTFRRFAREIRPPFRSGNHGSVVRAKILGRFFQGKGQSAPAGSSNLGGGYGHMGCCSLLAIQEVESVDPQDRDDLDYGASPPMPTWDYRFLSPIEPGASVVEDQKQADLGLRAWAFDDPERVASEAIVGFTKVKAAGPLRLKVAQRLPGRIICEWRQSKGQAGTSSL